MITYFDYYIPQLLNCGLLIDIGVNQGVHLNHMLRYAQENCGTVVIGFEPNPFLNLQHYKQVVNQCAVGCRNEKTQFLIPRHQGQMIDSHGSLVKPHFRDRAHEMVETQVVRLDTYLSDIEVDLPVEFLKIDVEGGELDVLLGATDTLVQHRPMINLEMEEAHQKGCTTVIPEILDRLGYTGFFISDGEIRPFKEFSIEKNQTCEYNHLGSCNHQEQYVFDFVFAPKESEQKINQIKNMRLS